ncbi:MAG: GPO family capsid scaffolding protein [Proteobacteria bacterium]|nr:GPO family capsid scaffolding protein [Pseudomonadota bacterium]
MPTTKPFAVATEGNTIDGRSIPRSMIEDMAKSYDPAVYTALVNLEHFISAYPDSDFSAFGKVISLSTREIDILGDKKLQLMAVAEVSDAAAEMQYRGKKAFASVEIMPNFIGKGMSYLVGLALTDTPASVGTEPMRFSAFEKGENAAFHNETVFDIEDAKPTEAPETSAVTFIEKVMGYFRTKYDNDFNAEIKSCQSAISEIAGKVGAMLEKLTSLEQKVNTLEVTVPGFSALQTELSELKEHLESTPNTPPRPHATGASGAKTDC